MSLEAPGERHRNLLVSALLQPRKTIERIIATQPTRWVLSIYALGGASGVISQLFVYQWDWRTLVFGAVGGALLAIAYLYVASWIIAWLGRLMKGHASAQAVRAALAWGQLPGILGTLIAAVVTGAGLAFLGNTPL